MSTTFMSKKNNPQIDWARIGLGKKFDSQVAKETGVPRRQVTKIRTRLGIPSYSESQGAKITRNRRVDASQPAMKPITQVVAQSPILSTPKMPKVEKKTALKNYVTIVLDRSSSIAYYQLEDKLRQSYNGLVDTIKKNASESGQDTIFSLFFFGSAVTHQVVDVPADKIKHLTQETYRAYEGSTSLLDGIGAAIGYLKGKPDANNENVSHLVIVLTDGEENSSKTYKPDNIHSSDKRATKLLNLITEIQYAGNWTLAVQLPSGFKKKFVDAYGIPADNVREWEQTEAGIKETFEHTSGGIGVYYTARASGQSRVQNFYSMTTDLSKLSARDVKTKLDDISDKFKSYVLDREMTIKDFVELKTKRPYVVGSTFYQLFKKEEIQPQKQVLLMEHNKKAIWGGDQARDLIGLPQGKTAKVTPGNHSNYKIFCQSTSVNRILPRGTEILVDTTKLANDKETWASGYTS